MRVVSLALACVAAAPPDAVRIPAGTFLMGCVPRDQECEPAERPRHRVTLTRPFRLARTETTVAQYRRFVAATGHRTAAERDGRGRYWRFRRAEWDWIAGLSWRQPLSRRHAAPGDWPAVQLAWGDAYAYCRWAGGRLPTEAEWERAARGGIPDAIHPWGDAALPLVAGTRQANGPDRRTARLFPSFATYRGYDDGHATLAPVASYAPNGYGLHDMAGNVYEWTADWIADGPYPAGDAVDPRGIAVGGIKALRGGGWGYPPSHLRASFRGLAGTDFWTATFGFRCAWDRPPHPV